MTEEQKKIQLTVPAADSGKNPNTIVKLNDLKAWVEDLPYANQLGMAEKVLSSLRLLNRHPAKLPLRPNLMMLYMDPFTRIVEMARRISCQDQGNQRSKKNDEELLGVTGEICTEMAYGFKHIVIDEMRSKIKMPANECAPYINLAMQCLSTGLIFDMAAHRSESRTVWREIYQLLIRAQQLSMAHLEITNAIPNDGREVSILNSFKTILLTSILDPSRLTPNEIWGAYDYLAWYAKNARITPVEQAAPHPGNYLIPRDGMEKPALYDTNKPPANPERFMLLETHRLNLLISRHLDILSESKTALIRGTEQLDPGAKMQILRQMLHIWYTNPKRRHRRKDKFDRIACAFGVGSVYHFLKEGTMRRPYPQSGPDDNASPPQNSNMEPELSSILSTYVCRQENISANGMMILSSEQSIPKLRIGQMIVTESMIGETPNPLNIGIVRRIINKDPDTTEFGVQFIPGMLSAATALPEIFGREQGADLQPCIVLELGENKPKALITPHLIYQPSRNYVIDINGGATNRIIAGKLLESTECYDCFEYNLLQYN